MKLDTLYMYVFVLMCCMYESEVMPLPLSIQKP